MTRVSSCRLSDPKRLREAFLSIGLKSGECVQIDSDVLFQSPRKLAPLARDIVFTLGSLSAVLSLRTEDIGRDVARLARLGLADFFSEYTLRRRPQPGAYTVDFRIEKLPEGTSISR